MTQAIDKLKRTLSFRREKAEDFTLPSIIIILNLTNAQRSERQSFILQEFTKTNEFFAKLTKEHGEYVHRIVCEKLKHEFVPAGSVMPN
jgi:hypothetical protein